MQDGTLLLRDILPSAAIALAPTATLHEALGVLRRGRLVAAPVIANGSVLGTISVSGMDAWLARAHIGDAELDFGSHTVEEVMTRRVIVLAPHAALDTALDAMRGLDVEHIVVMDGRAYMGLVSMADVLRSRTR